MWLGNNTPCHIGGSLDWSALHTRRHTTNMDNTIFIVTASVVLGIFTVVTIVGNVFVIAAIITERNLRTTGNYLVLSLAVADLMVACLVMPLGAFSEIAQQWTLGTFLCDIWTSADVLCCTASILHLLAIALVSDTDINVLYCLLTQV